MSHVFISYVGENSALVDKLAKTLEANGVEVWLDKNKIKLGYRWKAAIRQAIEDGTFFMACFSKEYESRNKSYMNTELTLAIEELQQHPTDKAWFIPVKLSPCNIPDRDIGGNETLRDIQWVELYDHWDEGIQQIISVIQPTLPPLEPEMVIIPAGAFWMGSDKTLDLDACDAELPRHRVTISYSFALGRYPVTFEEYDRFAKAMSRQLSDDEKWGRGRRPIINVSWDEAVAYTQWLSRVTSKRYRLPTEAEWEYASRAGTETQYWWGDNIREDGQVWTHCRDCGKPGDGRATVPVGSFNPNLFGLYEVLGNVWEYVQDCWHYSYQDAPTDGSAWESGDCPRRVLRGGSWNYGPRDVRSATRGLCIPYTFNYDQGFRLAQDL
jgi:formylglycine-generating enzyme required for sulfatase activity